MLYLGGYVIELRFFESSASRSNPVRWVPDLGCYSYGGGLARHFGRDKTLIMVQGNFYWPKHVQVVEKIVKRCAACHKAKMHRSNAGLYTLLPIQTTP